MTQEINNQAVKNGDILLITSPIDDKELLVLATVTAGNTGFNVSNDVTLQEVDGVDAEASYHMVDNLPYQVFSNTSTLGSDFPSEYKAILKNMTAPCGPLVVARVIQQMKAPGVPTTKESINNLIEQAILEGAARVSIFSEKIQRFSQLAENYRASSGKELN